jgi:hypothetical protein
MFRDARTAERQRSAATFGRAMSAFRKTAENWFDGSVDSCDTRLARTDKLLHMARSTAARPMPTAWVRPYLAAISELEDYRRSVEALRHDLLTAAADRDDDLYPDPHPMSGLPRGRGNFKTRAEREPLHVDDRRWVELEAPKFLAANSDTTDDLGELATRARHHAEVRTSTFTPQRSRAITGAFVEKVVGLGRQVPRPRTASAPPVIDFDSQLLFIT